jgi:predicted dehydrogenase
MKKKLKLGIIGGGPGSWIGEVHRIASRLDNKFEVCAGVFSRNFKKNLSFANKIGVEKNRCYKNYKDLCLGEKNRSDGAEVISVMTPPGNHQEIAEYFIKNNFHVISDKPFASNIKQATSLYKAIKKNKKVIYGLTHNYSAYAMVRNAKKIIQDNKIGKIEYVNVEYIQNWAGSKIVNKKNSKKIFSWKLDKKLVGISTVLNELGSHAYHLCNYLTGLSKGKLISDIKKFSKDVNLDSNCQVLINYDSGAKGLFWTSTDAKGGVYGLKIRVYGSKGSLEWVQNYPNKLILNSISGATKVLERGFNESGISKNFERIKYGHPEGYLSAFSNIYREIAYKIKNRKSKKKNYYPTAHEGYLTAKFIDACVLSSRKKKWVTF